MKWMCVILLFAMTGCVNLTTQHKTIAERPALPPQPPVTADQITADNAHEMSQRLWDEMNRETPASSKPKVPNNP
jgi:hypothetical protein